MSLTPSGDSAIGTFSAQATTKRLLHEISNLGNAFLDCTTPSLTDSWLGKVDNMFEFCTGIEDGAIKGRAAMLINMQAIWTDLPKEFRDKFQNNFWVYASLKSGGRDQGTIENWMRAMRIFFIQRVAPSNPIEVPKRDHVGAVIKDSAGSPIKESVVWDPVHVPISKLVAIAGRANSDKMTPELWSLAADQGATWNQLQIALSSSGAGGAGGGDLEFYLSGPYLFAREGNVDAFVGSLTLPYDDDITLSSSLALRERALRKLMLVLNVREEGEDPDDALARVGMKLYRQKDS